MKFTGLHVVGRGRARTLGFPTINLQDINTIPREMGVYAVRATINENQYKAAMFLGESPTFKDKEKSLELHLIGLTDEDIKKFHLNIPIETRITVETVRYIRPVKNFRTKKNLIRQINKDIAEITKILTTTNN